jgi:8-oxo-dGTP pyrophosphatase MutT (NUDIX family)
MDLPIFILRNHRTDHILSTNMYQEVTRMTTNLNTTFLEKEARRFKMKVGVFLFLIRNDEVLLLRRANTGIADGYYVVPMGGLLEGETATEALIREASEEIGIQLETKNVEVCHVMHRFHRMPDGYCFPQIDFYFQASRWERPIVNCEPDRCDELNFYPLKKLPKKTEAFISQALECMLKGVFFSEYGWDRKEVKTV